MENENKNETIERLRSVILPEEISQECYEKVIDYLETIGFFDE